MILHWHDDDTFSTADRLKINTRALSKKSEEESNAENHNKWAHMIKFMPTPVCPEVYPGFKGLAAVLTYLIELRIWNEFVSGKRG